jgi:hypothetical protein
MKLKLAVLLLQQQYKKNYALVIDALSNTLMLVVVILNICAFMTVVPNGGGTAPRWALKRSKGAFLVQGKFRRR